MQLRWETINAVIRAVGGLIFVIGSLLFLPVFAAWTDVGAGLFIFGSLLYFVINVHDLVEVRRHRRQTAPENRRTFMIVFETVSALVYLVARVLFLTGSLLFLSSVDQVAAAAWCFVIASLMFAAGACVNILQIIQERTLRTLQLMNLTAVSFVVGSVLFAVASIPYLWPFQSSEDQRLVLTFLAWLYAAGSMLFVVGALFNYQRAVLVIRHHTGQPPPA